MAELATEQQKRELVEGIERILATPIATPSIQNTPNVKGALAADPASVIPDNRATENPPADYTFPKTLVGVNGGQDAGGYMQITCFKYERGYRDLQELESPNTPKKKQYTIRLPLPQTVSQEYSADLDQFKGSATFDLVQEAADDYIGGVASGVVGAAASGGVAMMKDLAGRFLRGAGVNTQGGLIGAISNQRNLASTAAGLSMNPRYEMAFNSMNIRQHSFDFNLIPTDKEETDIIRELVHQLRLSSHPEPADNVVGFFYQYPDEFIITFHDHRGRRILEIPYIPDCIIRDIGVAHTTGRLHTDGSPVATRLTIQFQELQALDRNDIKRIAK